MDLSVKLGNQDIVFSSKLTKFSKQNMDRKLLPMLKRSHIDLKTMVTESEYTNNAICNWFKKTFGVSAAKYFKNREQEVLKNEILEFYKNGTPIKEIAKHYGLTRGWVYEQFMKFRIKISRAELNSKLDQNMPIMIKKGDSIEAMAKKNNCSETKIQRWLNENVEEGIVKFRHDNGIKLVHSTRNTNDFTVNLIQECFDAGYSIKETSKLLGITVHKIIRIKNIHKLKTDLDHAHSLLDKFLPDFIEAKESLTIMSRIVGLSKVTIARKIRELYGKNYIDIRLNR